MLNCKSEVRNHPGIQGTRMRPRVLTKENGLRVFLPIFYVFFNIYTIFIHPRLYLCFFIVHSFFCIFKEKNCCLILKVCLCRFLPDFFPCLVNCYPVPYHPHNLARKRPTCSPTRAAESGILSPEWAAKRLLVEESPSQPFSWHSTLFQAFPILHPPYFFSGVF